MKAEKSILTPAEVCAILKACGEAQVRVLKFANLYVQFDKKVEPARTAVAEAPAPTTEAEISETNQKIHEDALAQDEQAVRQDQLDQMWIENPLEAERILLAGELEDGDTEDE
jgi:hypothetical protein